MSSERVGLCPGNQTDITTFGMLNWELGVVSSKI